MPISRGLSGQLEDGEIPDNVGFSDGLQKFRCMQGGIVLKVIDLRLRNTPSASSLTHNPANSHDFTLNND